MSISSEKGKSLETYIAKVLQKKLGARVKRDGKSGAGTHQKMDISDYFQDTPLDIEAKNHATIKLREWWRQTIAGASFRRVPSLVLQMDDEVLVTLRFTDLVDFLAEIQQGKAEITDLRRPIAVPKPMQNEIDQLSTTRASSAGLSLCRNGHIISPGSTKCLAKGCQFSFGYKPKKVKK